MTIEPGSSLSHYRFAGMIGEGGMGQVWRATDTTLGRDVAIKVLPPAFAADRERLARLEREARVLASLNHPHIASLYGLERSGEAPCLVMELVEGETLADRLALGPIPPDEALAIAVQIASALEAAHEKGIIHRDLKPANLKLSAPGRVKLLDFGLAEILPSAETSPDASGSPTHHAFATRTGAILGSAPYMSPEQARGRPLDGRTDIWSFGCVLFEMLSGRRAFPADNVSDALAAILTKEPEWDSLPSGTPDRIGRLLRRCLRKDPARRLRDIGDARLEIEEAEPPPAAAAPREAARTGPRWSGYIGSALGGAAVMLAAWLLLGPGPAAPRGRKAEARFVPVTNFAGVESQPSFSPDGRSVVFASNHGGRWDLYLGLVAGGSPIRLTDDPATESRPRWSPDGNRILFARLDDTGLSDLWIVPALGGAARRLVRGAMTPAWSADGRRIAYSSGGGITVADTDGSNAGAITHPEEDLFDYQPAFSHDGRSIAFIRRRGGPYGELRVVVLASGETRDLTNDGAVALCPVWSPDDRFIYFASSRGGTVNIWKIPSGGGSPIQITAGQGDDADLDLSADGTKLIFSSFRANMNLAEVGLDPAAGGRLKWLTTDSARGETWPRYSPDGRRIAYFSNRAGAEPEGIWVMDEDGRNAAPVTEDGRVNIHPRWMPGGEEILYVSRQQGFMAGEMRAVSLSGGAPRSLPIQPWGGQLGDVAPDGRLIYQLSSTAGELYDLATGRREPVPDLPGAPRWSRDGKSYAFVVPPRPDRIAEAGLWVAAGAGPRAQVFPGWVAAFAWGAADDLLVLEGKADMKGMLWRVNAATRARQALMSLPLFLSHVGINNTPAFDVHPDGRRIVVSALEFFESDVGMIENIP